MVSHLIDQQVAHQSHVLAHSYTHLAHAQRGEVLLKVLESDVVSTKIRSVIVCKCSCAKIIVVTRKFENFVFIKINKSDKKDNK